MLSILLPIYNFNVIAFVKAIHSQALAMELDFEIRCYDDGSEKSFKLIHRKSLALSNVFYFECPHNIGRSAIRNLMAREAQFPYLLFLDNDGALIHDDFVANYVKHLQNDAIIYGGRVYAHEKPQDQSLYLHWHYGTHRESMALAKRMANPYHSFMTNNFVVPRAIINDIGFDEQLTTYGHEDTLFGQRLKVLGINIVHIENPVVHLGLEKSDVFLAKTKDSVENLYTLYRQGKIAKEGIKLLETFHKLERFGLKRIVNSVLKLIQPLLVRNLKSSSPNLFYLDLYKLHLILTIKKG